MHKKIDAEAKKFMHKIADAVRGGPPRGENGFWSLYDVSQVSRTGETNRQSGVAEVGRLGDGYKSAARQCSPERAGGREPH